MTQTATRISDPQRLRALERANEIRLARAGLKRRIAIGEVSAAEVHDPSAEDKFPSTADVVPCGHSLVLAPIVLPRPVIVPREPGASPFGNPMPIRLHVS